MEAIRVESRKEEQNKKEKTELDAYKLLGRAQEFKSNYNLHTYCITMLFAQADRLSEIMREQNVYETRATEYKDRDQTHF